MRQWQHRGQITLPLLHTLGDCSLPGQVPGLRVLADDQRQLDIRQLIEQGVAPRQGTFGSRWQITGCTSAWITKPHGQYGDTLAVIEGFPIHAHPVAQPVTTGIVKWQAGVMRAQSRSLRRHKNTGRSIKRKHRARLQWQMLGAKPTLPHLVDQRQKPVFHRYFFTHEGAPPKTGDRPVQNSRRRRVIADLSRSKRLRYDQKKAYGKCGWMSHRSSGKHARRSSLK